MDGSDGIQTDAPAGATAAVASSEPPTIEQALKHSATGAQPRPPIYRGQPYTSILAFVAAMAVYWLWRVSGNGLTGEDLMQRWVFYSIIVIGFYIVFGVSGQFAFSQAAFAGLGAYTSNW